MLEQTRPLTDGLAQLASSVVSILPALLTALALMLVGWLIARLLRALTLRSARTLNRGVQAIGLGNLAHEIGSHQPTIRVLASIVYWLVILFFLAAATNVLGLSTFAGWLDRLVSHLPNILSGVLIIFVGAILARIARDAVMATLPSLTAQQRSLLGRIVQALTLTILVVVGLDQIGIDITVITTVLAVAVAAFLGGLSLAFSLGARTFVSNIIGAHYLDRDYHEGQRIRIRGMEGTILEITSVAVLLDTADGRLAVPAHVFAEDAALILTPEADNG